MADDELRINFSDDEASSRSFDPLPTGRYEVYISDGSLEHSKSEKNPGKPYWHLEMTVSDGPYADRKVWGNVMLWEGAAFSLAQLLKAVGRGDVLDKQSKSYGRIPPLDDFIGQKIAVQVKKQRDDYVMRDAAPGEPVQFKNEIKGYASLADAEPATAGASKKNSLFP
jgi:hypothetical protein